MSLVVVLAYALGAWLGLLSARSPKLATAWPRVVRTQLLVASVVLSVVSAWRLRGVEEFLWPLLMVGVFALLLVVSLVASPGSGRAGAATMRAWSALPNTAYWVTPVSASLAGPPGMVVAVLADRLAAPLWAIYVWLLRRDAPTPQRRATSWIDQSPVLALMVGLGLRAIGPPPDWTLTVSLVFVPVLAATGAAVYVGSVLHPSQRIDPRAGLADWGRLIALRVALFAAVAWLAPSPSIALVAVLCGLSIPAFGAAQFSTVYGYAEPAVAAGSRYGWTVGGVGLLVAYYVMR